MTSPLTVGGRPHPQVTPAGAWARFWRGLLAAARGYHPESDPARASAGTAAAGDPQHFIDLFARYHLPLVEYLFGMTHDRELAADLAQDTFVHAWAAAPDLAGIVQPRAWLYRIATRVALDAVRHRRHIEWLPLSRVEPEAGGRAAEAWSALPPFELPSAGGDLVAGVAERDAIWTVLAQLPPRWRAVLLLHRAAGFEVREVAALLHLSEANVRKCIFRARDRFRTLYRQLDAEGAAR